MHPRTVPASDPTELYHAVKREKILLAGPDYEENLSIRYLSGSLLKAGHQTVLAAFNVAAEMGAVAYPKSAAPGDVLLDVTLREDGSVAKVEVVDGDAVLAEAAVSAVKQWKYRPLPVEERTVNKFVVVVTFGKNGKVK